MKLRRAKGRYVNYTTPRGGGLLADEPHYAQFDELQYLDEDGYWKPIPEEWVGDFNGPKPSRFKTKA